MDEKCIFCRKTAKTKRQNDTVLFKCQVCGNFKLDELTYTEFQTFGYSREQKRIIGINVRDEWERKNKKEFVGVLNFKDFEAFIKRGQLYPLDLMDKVLFNFNKKCKIIADEIPIDLSDEYIYYHCTTSSELNSVLKMLLEEGFIKAHDKENPQNGSKITVKGYSRLRELQRINKESRQCFVAMWFADEMKEVYENAIRPAIEYTEDGENKPRFKSVRVDTVQHVNDINDEIIAQIRRSRFMVCDLTGYRGGIYFEAGFAYGLGLDVIYTCRKDWCNQDILYNGKRDEVKELFDSNGTIVEVKKEGIHFDLAHRNRIIWEHENLNKFEKELKNRIKAVIT